MNKQTYEKLISDCVKELSNDDPSVDHTREELNRLITITKTVSENVCKQMDLILKFESKNNVYVQWDDIENRIEFNDMLPILILHRGDITKLKVGAIVNAANSGMLGCFTPGHKCVDNVIHCASGPRLRNECYRLTKSKPNLITGEVVITPAYSLPSKFVIHTVGPIISDNNPTIQQRQELQDCYYNSLELAKINNLHEIAFSNLSTGVFGYPIDLACVDAIESCLSWINKNRNYDMKIIFCTFTNDNYNEYFNKFEELVTN